jgi:ankyrin repeat protein
MRMLLAAALLITACAVPRSDFSPLVEAARVGDTETFARLCANGADPNAPSGDNGWSPLMHAIHKLHKANVLAALLDAGADPNVAAPNGVTPLMMVSGYGQEENVALLLRRGARTDLRDHNGDTALDYALTGVTDVDDFTYFRCQTESVSLLRPKSPAAQASAERWAKFKGC